MVCVPCIVIPFLLWFFHRYCKPWITKLFPSWFPQKVEEEKSSALSAGDTNILEGESQKVAQNGVAQNGVANGVCNGQTVTAGDDSKKDK